MLADRLPPNRHIALLRGINVGGKNKLPMRELAALFEQAGCTDVRTYIQSGNVVYTAPSKVAKGLAGRVEAGILDRFDIRSSVITRTARELATILDANPFVAEGVDVRSLHVAFCARRPSGAAAATLDPDRSPGDRFHLAGREIYLHLPGGVARTKLTNAWFDNALVTTTTIRNWRTIRKLSEMAAGV